MKKIQEEVYKKGAVKKQLQKERTEISKNSRDFSPFVI